MEYTEFKERCNEALNPIFDQWALEKAAASTWTYQQGYDLAHLALDGVLDVLSSTLYADENKTEGGEEKLVEGEPLPIDRVVLEDAIDSVNRTVSSSAESM